jgi:drug/metabolite transporter (DMT)-like permease
MPDPLLGQLLALGTAFCWVVSSVSFEHAGRRIGSVAVNLIRLCMALLMLSAYGFIRLGQTLPLEADANAWMWMLLSGLVGFFIGDLALFRAFLLIGARLSMLIMSLAPPMTAVAGWLFLGERIGGLGVIGMVVTLVGVGWVVSERRANPRGAEHVSRAGVVLAVIAAAGQAGGVLVGKHGMTLRDGSQLDPFLATQIRVLAGIAGFALLVSFTGFWPKVLHGLRDLRAMGLMLVGAVAGPFLGVSLVMWSVQLIPSGVSQTLVATVPVLMLPYAVFVAGERVSRRAVLGAVVAVAGVALLMLT